MTELDFLVMFRTAVLILALIGIILCIIGWQLVSIARSLKKVAARDVQPAVFYLPADFRLPSNLHHEISNIAWEAGRNFQAGMRTDR